MPTQYWKEKNYDFKLSNLESKEDFTIWAAWDKKSQEIKDPDGNAYKFPIRDGQLTGKDGQVRTMEDIKFMKRAEFLAQYPDFSKSTAFNRVVLIGGAEYYARFCMAANTELEKQIANLKTLNINPIDVTFKQIYHPQNSPMNKYAIEITNANTPQQPQTTEDKKHNVTPPGTNQDGAPVQPTEPVEQGPQLTEKEKNLIEAVKSLSAPITEENFNKIAKSNGFDDESIKKLFGVLPEANRAKEVKAK